MRRARALRVLCGTTIAAGLVASAAAMAQQGRSAVDEMDAYTIICTGTHGQIVFSTSDVYGVSIDRTGTIYTYRTGWLSDQTYTYVKGADVSCIIRPTRR